jgi:trimethylguanosine synthase
MLSEASDCSSTDVIILAPPWGGPDYSQVKHFDLRTMLPSGCGIELVGLAAKHIVKEHCTIVGILPKNTQQIQIQEIFQLYGLLCEIDRVHLGDALKLQVIYFYRQRKTTTGNKKSEKITDK